MAKFTDIQGYVEELERIDNMSEEEVLSEELGHSSIVTESYAEVSDKYVAAMAFDLFGLLITRDLIAAVTIIKGEGDMLRSAVLLQVKHAIGHMLDEHDHDNEEKEEKTDE